MMNFFLSCHEVFQKKNFLLDVHTVEYNVLLSYPDFSNPNYLWIKDTNGKVVYKSEGVSPSIAPEKQNMESA